MIHWVAGFLEGEGSFGQTRRGTCRQPSIQANTTDLDIAIKLSILLQAKVKPPRLTSQISKLPSYEVRVTGAKAVGWMMTLYPLLGERRQVRVKRALLEWKTAMGRWGKTPAAAQAWQYAKFVPVNDFVRLRLQADQVVRVL